MYNVRIPSQAVGAWGPGEGQGREGGAAARPGIARFVRRRRYNGTAENKISLHRRPAPYLARPARSPVHWQVKLSISARIVATDYSPASR